MTSKRAKILLIKIIITRENSRIKAKFKTMINIRNFKKRKEKKRWRVAAGCFSSFSSPWQRLICHLFSIVIVI